MSHGTKSGSRAPSAKIGRNKRKCEKYALIHGGGQQQHSGKMRYKPTKRSDKPDMTTRRVLDRPWHELSKSQKDARLKTQEGRSWPTLNPGRSTVVKSIYKSGSVVIGYNAYCLNCGSKKTFLAQYFKGVDNSYALACAHSTEHTCNMSTWKACA